MNLKPISWRKLWDRDERTIARIAAVAISNTVFGGASALVYAKRLIRMGGQDVRHVVSDVYSASTGRAHSQHSAWECPECGGAHLGQDNAAACCTQELEEAA